MKIIATARFIFSACLLAATTFQGKAQDSFTDADAASIKAFLHDNFEEKNTGMVVGLVDKNGSQVFSAGKLDNGTDAKVDGDTLFEIGSITKTFTTLLLVDMVERGQMKLDDPVSKYLPAPVKAPTRNGKEITLLDLATHMSGFPPNPDNLVETKIDGENPWASYDVKKMYAFLSSCRPARDPGEKYEYSNYGVALLGHVIALKAGTTYETLVRERICRPLQMDSTYVTIPPNLKARFAMGHVGGKISPNWDIGAAVAAGGLRSTANDLLKYVSANIGLKPSRLTPLMQKTHVILHKDGDGTVPGDKHGNTGMGWMDMAVYQPEGMQLLGHAGGTGSFGTFIGFDKKQRRGIVVLSNQREIHSSVVGYRILQHERLSGIDPTRLDLVRERVGTGIAFDSDKETHLARIIAIYRESFAAKAGLYAGMIIQKIDGVSTLNKSVPECLALFRANGAPTVGLELLDPKSEKTRTVVLARGKFLTDPILTPMR